MEIPALAALTHVPEIIIPKEFCPLAAFFGAHRG